MQYIWEPEDIIPGRGVVKEKISSQGKMRFYMIGVCGIGLAPTKEQRFFLIPLDEGGRILPLSTKSELANYLTECNFIPTTVLAPRDKTGYTLDGYGRLTDLQAAFKLIKRCDYPA